MNKHSFREIAVASVPVLSQEMLANTTVSMKEYVVTRVNL